MFWNDIAEIKHWMNRLTERLCRIDENVNRLSEKEGGFGDISKWLSHMQTLIETHHQLVTEKMDGLFDSEDEYHSINRIHNKLNCLVDDEKRKEEVELATKTLDKFEDYMKNVDKLNAMVNEFKGCVSVARGALQDRREASEQEAKTASLAAMTKEIHKSMLAFIEAGNKIKHEAHYKIDFIYNNIEKFAEFMQDCEKKSRKGPKSVKKKRKVSQDPISE